MTKAVVLIAALFSFLLISCGGGEDRTQENHPEPNADTIASDTLLQDPALVDDIASWKDPYLGYAHFKKTKLDTVRIGPYSDFTDPFEYFSETRSNEYVIIEEGEYLGYKALWIDGENLIIKGEGEVALYLDVLYDNVMWIIGENIVVDNLKMCHWQPGEEEGQNCSGRVIGFDGADNITIMNCDLNGCGLAGLHDNLGNGTVFVEHNYIHNNSLGAYTDIDGNVWQEETDHPVFEFRNNLIENNGPGRIKE